MKILQLTNKPPWPLKDGGAIAVLNLTKGFAASGHPVTVLAMNTRKHHINPGEIPEEIRQYADFRFSEVAAEITPFKILLNFLFSKEPFTAVRFISRVYAQDLTGMLSETAYDVIQLEGLYLCPYIPLIRKHSRAKIVYRAHNIESEIWERTAAASRGIKKFYLRNLAARILKFEKRWLNGYDLLVPITGRDGRKLNEMGNLRPVHAAPSGIDPVTCKSAVTEPEFPSLFHIGSLDWTPNQEGLLWFLKNCWNDIRNRIPGLNFYIAGRNAPQWMVAKFSLPGVVYLGEVPDAAEFIRSKAVMVVPLLSGSGMRVKIVEGMSLGKAIVSTSIGAEGLPVTNTQNILLADSPEEMVKVIENVFSDRDLCDQIGHNAALFVSENLNNLRIAEKLVAFYQNNLS